MKRETRYRSIPYDVFIAKDGEEFEDEKKCILHEKFMDGTAKICPCCNGEGFITVTVIEEDYHTGAPFESRQHSFCGECGGKGYLEKTEIWK